MSKIPSIVYNATLRTYRPRDKDSVVVSEKKTSDPFGFGKQFTHVKLMSNLSVRGFMQKQEDYRQQIVNYNTAAQKLAHAAETLTNPVFLEEKNIDISNPGAFTHAEASHNAQVAVYEVKVSQLASPQVNEGKSFLKNAHREMPAGIYTLGIEAYGRPERQATVYIAENDNTTRVMQKFANVINAGGADVVAQAKEEKNEIYLYLKAREPGISNSFTIRDIHGNAVEELGINNVTESARNNIYSVNGVKHESESNILAFDDENVVFTVEAVAETKIDITRNYDKPIAAVRDIAAQYNNLKDVLSANSAALSNRGGKLLAGLTTLVGNIQKDDLQSIGISIDEDTNRMVVDENKLFKNITNDPEKVKWLLSEKPGLGVLSRSLAKTVQENPLSSFVKTPTMLDSIDYGWRWRSAGSIGIISLGAFAAFNQGMFFDRFV